MYSDIERSADFSLSVSNYQIHDTYNVDDRESKSIKAQNTTSDISTSTEVCYCLPLTASTVSYKWRMQAASQMVER
jgi:hypothetical protein